MNEIQVLFVWLDLVATTMLVGGLAYATFVEAPQSRGRYALHFACLLLGATLAFEILLNALRMQQISGINGLTLVADVWEMKWSHWWALRVATLGTIALGLRRAAPPWRILLAIGSVSLLARSFQGHAGAHGTIPALFDWVHLGAASLWVGGLLQLFLEPALLPRTAPRASGLFAIALGPLVLAGIYAARLHVGTLSRLLDTSYGRVLLGKLAVAALAVTIGALNRYRNLPALARGGASANRRLVRAMRIEVLLLVIVLLLSAVLGVLLMPHAM
jgi:putative copper export protein